MKHSSPSHFQTIYKACVNTFFCLSFPTFTSSKKVSLFILSPMKNRPQPAVLPLPPKPQLFMLVISFLLLTFGVAIGIIFSSFIKTIPFISLQTIQQLPTPYSPPPPKKLSVHGLKDYVTITKIVMHDMSDEELLWKASMVPRKKSHPYMTTPKVAFLFLVRGKIPFGPLWERFFKGHKDLYSIYVHSDPSYNESVPEDSVFYGRSIPSKPVNWGNVNMMEAERRLLANALLDFSNQCFVLLSESCIPLFNLPTVHSHLINSNQTFVQVFDELGPTGRGRYNKNMAPLIMPYQWRKGSQWFEIDRELAIEVVSDETYFPLFKKHCKHKCYVDEHYLPTLVHMKFGWKNSNRSVTWVNWSRSGPHPMRYPRTQVTPDMLKELRGGSNCTYNGKVTNTCFLFARKFLPNSLIRFEKFAPKVLDIYR